MRRWSHSADASDFPGCQPFPLPDCHPAGAALVGCPPVQATRAADTYFGQPGFPSKVHHKDTNTAATSVSSESHPVQGPTHTPRQTSEGTGPLSEQDRLPQPLQHVSIDVVCTPQQLSQIMGTLVGTTSSVTLKVENMNTRDRSSG